MKKPHRSSKPNNVISMDLGFLSAIDRSLEQASGGRIGLDYSRLIRWIEGELGRAKVLAFYRSRTAPDADGYGSRRPLEKYLQSLGVQVRFASASGPKEKSVGCLLEASTFELAQRTHVDQVTLITGNGYFIGLVDRIHELGKSVNLVTANYSERRLDNGRYTRSHRCNFRLQAACDRILLLNELLSHPCDYDQEPMTCEPEHVSGVR